MATKYAVTANVALNVALNVLQSVDITSACAAMGVKPEDVVERIQVLVNQNASKSTSKAPSKASIQNLNLAKQVADAFKDAEAFTTDDVLSLGIPDVATRSKVTAVITRGRNEGMFEKGKNIKGKTSYKVVSE